MKKYEEIQRYILDKIKDSRLSPLDMIESEKTLCEKFDVSRMTARRALDELVTQGVLYRVQGKGTFVSKSKRFKEFGRLLSFAEEAAEMGLVVKNVVISCYKSYPDAILCARMNITPQKSVTHVNRIRMVNNEPLAYEESCFLTSVIGDINEEIAGGSIYHYLENVRNVKISHGNQDLDAVSADNKLAVMLGVPEGTALLRMTMTAYTSKDIVFEYARTYYRCDRYTFSQVTVRNR